MKLTLRGWPVRLLPVCVCALAAAAARASSDLAAAGRALYHAGRYREAAQAFREAVAHRPSDPTAWLWYGAALVRAGEARQALDPLRRASRSWQAAHAWLWTGEAYEQLRQDALAREAYETVVRLHPASDAAYWAARRLRALRARDRAERLASDPVTYAQLARQYNPRLAPHEALRIGRALVHYGRTFDIDPRFTSALVLVESGFNPRAVSPAGALGLGQLMPEAARSVGVRDPFSIEENLYGTVRVLRGHLDRFGYHRVDLALAAYNAGTGAVSRHGGVPPYSETQWYVYRVSRLYLRFVGR